MKIDPQQAPQQGDLGFMVLFFETLLSTQRGSNLEDQPNSTMGPFNQKLLGCNGPNIR